MKASKNHVHPNIRNFLGSNLKPIQHHWDELEQQQHWILLMLFVAEWDQIPAAGSEPDMFNSHVIFR